MLMTVEMKWGHGFLSAHGVLIFCVRLIQYRRPRTHVGSYTGGEKCFISPFRVVQYNFHVYGEDLASYLTPMHCTELKPFKAYWLRDAPTV
jgi:hypothetical protein